MMPGARKDAQSVDRYWRPVQDLIDGVAVHEVSNVTKDTGYLTEVFRADWGLDDGAVDQVFQVVVFPGRVSAWHTHRETLDRLFVNLGQVKIVLYDAREDSPTRGLVNVFRLGSVRPALLIVPPGVWHGLQNVGSEPAAVLNAVDRAYDYEDPDHWRLPADTSEIPYRWT
jgi:dTDP-4-dehydrorhamnose 3,5-epimerase